MNSTIKNKRFCTFVIFLIAIISAAVAVSPAFIAAALPDHLWWILVIFIPLAWRKYSVLQCLS